MTSLMASQLVSSSSCRVHDGTADALMISLRCSLPRLASSNLSPSSRAALERDVRRHSVLCHAGNRRWELSTYKFPNAPSAATSWLENCIHAAVKNLHRAPFIQLMSSDSVDQFAFHEVAPSVVHVPQLWRGIAQHVGNMDPEVMVLVHPIPLDEEDRAEASIDRASRDSRGSTKVLSGITSQTTLAREHHLRLQACAQLVQTGMAQTELAGRVGNCCDGDVSSQVVPFSRGHASHASQQTFHSPSLDQANGVSFWGVVIQSKSHSSELEGCYVLKTVHSGSASCHCTHYTLTRVCKGEPLAAQLAASWLVQPSSMVAR